MQNQKQSSNKGGGENIITLLIIADDFTGALDTGVQFAAYGIETRVVVGTDVHFTEHAAKVLVVDSETRHLSPVEAYQAVAKLTEAAVDAGISYIYKKTDSALRGNIGSELAALLDASGRSTLPFLPAYPQMGRLTRKGVHYIDDIPVKDSPFGADPFSPVKESYIPALIAEQTALPAHSLTALKANDPPPQLEGMLVFDAEDTEDLYHTGRQLKEAGKLHIMAGCAGFAAVLPEILGIQTHAVAQEPELDPRLLIVCGSVNPITLTQLDVAENAGFSRIRLTPRQKLEQDFWDSDEGRIELDRIVDMLTYNPHCIIDTNGLDGEAATMAYAHDLQLDLERIRIRIASGLGLLVAKLFTSPSIGTLLLTGGDTLLQCMNYLGAKELEPVCELDKGVVLTRFTYQGSTRQVITKSGGFGQENLLTDLAKQITK